MTNYASPSSLFVCTDLNKTSVLPAYRLDRRILGIPGARVSAYWQDRRRSSAPLTFARFYPAESFRKLFNGIRMNTMIFAQRIEPSFVEVNPYPVVVAALVANIRNNLMLFEFFQRRRSTHRGIPLTVVSSMTQKRYHVKRSVRTLELFG